MASFSRAVPNRAMTTTAAHVRFSGRTTNVAARSDSGATRQPPRLMSRRPRSGADGPGLRHRERDEVRVHGRIDARALAAIRRVALTLAREQDARIELLGELHAPLIGRCR